MPPLTNGMQSGSRPIQLAFPLPDAPSVCINIHLTIHAVSIVLFMTTTLADSAPSTCSLGSFVYAIPGRDATTQPLTTPLYTQTHTLDLAIRMAKILARKTRKPTYVGNSMSFAGAGRGGDVEEEMAGFKRIVEVVMEQVDKADVTG